MYTSLSDFFEQNPLETITIVALLLIVVIAIGAALVLSYREKKPGKKTFGSIQKALWGRKVEQSRTKPELGRRGEDPKVVRQKRALPQYTLDRKLRISGWPIEQTTWLTIRIASMFLAIVPYMMGLSVFSVLAAAIIPPVILSIVLDWQTNRKLKDFGRDFHVFLLSFASLIRVGLELIPALSESVRDLKEGSKVREEIGRVLYALKRGADTVDALSLLGKGFYHPQLRVFRNALIINYHYGGALRDVVTRMALTSKKEVFVNERVAGAVALERMSMWVVTIIMCSLFAFLYFQNPELIAPDDKPTVAAAVGEFGIVGILFGFIWAQKICNQRFDA